MKLFRVFSFCTVLLLAFFLRGQEVLTNNYLFLLDMGRDMLAVKGIVFDHHLTLIGPYTSLAGVFQGPFYYYLLAIPTFIFNGDPLGPLILMLIISLATALLAFYFLKKHFGFTPAILGFFLFAVCPEAVAAATYTWNPHPMWLLIVLFIFLIFELHLGKKWAHLALWLVIGFMFHFEAALGFFILATTFLYLLIHLRRKLFSKEFFIGILFLSLTFAPQVLFELRHNFLMTNSVISMVNGKNESLMVKGEQEGFIPILQNHFDAFINNYLTSFPYIKIGYLPFVLFLGSIVAFYLVRKSKKTNEKHRIFYSFFFKFLLIFILLTSFYQFPIRYWFLTGFQSFYLISTTLTLSLFWKYRIGKGLIVIFFMLSVFYVGERLNLLYINPPDDGGVAKIKGKMNAIDTIYRDAKGENFGLLIFTPPVLTDAYDYLIWWRSHTKNIPIPHKEKTGTFYLLIEPDPSQPHSYKGWLETVIKSGKVIKTVELPSGLIIQKRVETK